MEASYAISAEGALASREYAPANETEIANSTCSGHLVESCDMGTDDHRLRVLANNDCSALTRIVGSGSRSTKAYLASAYGSQCTEPTIGSGCTWTAFNRKCELTKWWCHVYPGPPEDNREHEYTRVAPKPVSVSAYVNVLVLQRVTDNDFCSEACYQCFETYRVRDPLRHQYAQALTVLDFARKTLESEAHIRILGSGQGGHEARTTCQCDPTMLEIGEANYKSETSDWESWKTEIGISDDVIAAKLLAHKQEQRAKQKTFQEDLSATNHKLVVDFLREHGFEGPNSFDKENCLPLEVAAMKSDASMVSLLLLAGAKPAMKNRQKKKCKPLKPNGKGRSA